MQIKFEKEQELPSHRSYKDDIERNLSWAKAFIKNFNDIYENENQSFFIKICEGNHPNKYFIAFILHPQNTFPLGNFVCPVYVDQIHDNFLRDFKLGFKIIFQNNKEYLKRKEK